MRRYQVEFEVGDKIKTMIVECERAQDFEEECEKTCPNGAVKSYKCIAQMYEVQFQIGNGPDGVRGVTVFAEDGDSAYHAAVAEYPQYAGYRTSYIRPAIEDTRPVPKRGPGRPPKAEAA